MMIEDPQRVVPGRVDIEGLQVLESCAFTWIFDGATLLFRRVPRDAWVSHDVATAWVPYHRLEVDGSRSCFVVILDDTGSRILRAWLHTEPCRRCSPEWETSGDAKRSILWWKDRLDVVDRRWAVPRAGRSHLLRPFGGWLRTEGAPHHG